MQLRMVALQGLAFGLLLGPCDLSDECTVWVNYPTAGVPRTQDGKPDLAAACPRTADGKPDFSGLWVTQTGREGNPNFPGEPVSDEFVNIAANLEGRFAISGLAADLVKARRSETARKRSDIKLLPDGAGSFAHSKRAEKVAQMPGLLILKERIRNQLPADLYGWTPLPADPNPSWNGYSSGKREGDALVVQTNGLRDGMWLDATGNLRRTCENNGTVPAPQLRLFGN